MNTLSPSDITEISDCINHYYEKAILIYKSYQTQPKPTFSFNLSGTVAGYAYFHKNHIKINPELFVRNKAKFLYDTIPHELAHLVAYNVYRDNGHGSGWQRVMINLGCEPNRCHSYDVSAVKRNYTVRRFVYSCGCREHYITAQKHNKLQKNSRQFICSSCRGNLSYMNRYDERKS